MCFFRTISASLLTDTLNTPCVEMPVVYLCLKLAASNCTGLLFIYIKSETNYLHCYYLVITGIYFTRYIKLTNVHLLPWSSVRYITP